MAARKDSGATPTPHPENTAAYDPAEDAAAIEVMSERELAKAMGGEVVKVSTTRVFDTEQLGTIDSFQAALDLAKAQYGTIVIAHEEPLLGDGFRKATDDDKRRMVGQPLLFLEWTFQPSDFGGEDWVFSRVIQRGE